MFPLWKITHFGRSPLSALSNGSYFHSTKFLKKPQKLITRLKVANPTVTENASASVSAVLPASLSENSWIAWFTEYFF